MATVLPAESAGLKIALEHLGRARKTADASETPAPGMLDLLEAVGALAKLEQQRQRSVDPADVTLGDLLEALASIGEELHRLRRGCKCLAGVEEYAPDPLMPCPIHGAPEEDTARV